MEYCKFCTKECKSKRSKESHERLCSDNPGKRTHPSLGRVAWNTGITGKTFHSEETKKKISLSSIGRTHSDSAKLKLSESAKRRNLGGVRPSRWIEYNGIMLGSSYEVKLAKSLDENKITWERPKRIGYTDPFGKSRTYTADFYLPDYDIYLDPKNDYLINNINPSLGFSDKEKISLVQQQNGIRVLILNSEQLNWASVVKLV